MCNVAKDAFGGYAAELSCPFPGCKDVIKTTKQPSHGWVNSNFYRHVNRVHILDAAKKVLTEKQRTLTSMFQQKRSSTPSSSILARKTTDDEDNEEALTPNPKKKKKTDISTDIFDEDEGADNPEKEKTTNFS